MTTACRTRTLAAIVALAALDPAPARGQDRPRGVLSREIAPLLQTRRFRTASWGALVVSLTRGDTLFAWHPDRLMVPASNAKLFTTAAALHYLGTDFRFVTALFAGGRVNDGVLYGDLVLYGTGDPTFGPDTASLAPFADSVVRAGIRRVRGDVVGDASFLGAELTGPGWSPDNFTRPFAAPPSALNAAENLVVLTVVPGEGTGARAAVTMDPPNDYYAVTSTVATGRPRTRTRIVVVPGATPRALELHGVIAPDRASWRTSVVVHEPALFAAGLLRRLLAARGVAVDGGVRSETADAPERARQMLAVARGAPPRLPGALAVRLSEPLDELVAMINPRSHNLSAELAFRTIGRSVGGAGTFAAGAQAVGRFLREEVGLPDGSFRISDGSGLSLLDGATPRALVRLLAWMRRAPEGAAFYASLPVVGDGIRSRMLGTPAVGRLRAKTGTLSDVSALSGYVTTVSGEELVFALLVNGSRSLTRARRAQDSVGILLAEFDRGAPPSEGESPGAAPRGAAPAPSEPGLPRAPADSLRP